MHSPLRSTIPVETLMLAYRSGIFPMADTRDDEDVFWVEPRDRAILPLDQFHMSKSLRKAVRTDRYVITIDSAFEQVVRACAQPRPGHPETWISERIVRSYTGLFEAGHAHSIECWRSGEDGPDGPQLVGGLYGVCFDRVFCGESMFARADDASKVALAWLVALMRRARFQLLDCQFMTDHLATMGAMEMPQRMYLQAVESARGAPAMTLPQAYATFTHDAGIGGYSASGVDAGAGARAAAGADEAAGADGAALSSSPGKLIAQSLIQTS